MVRSEDQQSSYTFSLIKWQYIQRLIISSLSLSSVLYFFSFFHAFSVLSVCIIQVHYSSSYSLCLSVSSPYSITPSSVFEHHSTVDSSVLSYGWFSPSLTAVWLFACVAHLPVAEQCVMYMEPGWRQESAMMLLTQGVMGYQSTVGEWLHAESGCCSLSLLSY